MAPHTEPQLQFIEVGFHKPTKTNRTMSVHSLKVPFSLDVLDPTFRFVLLLRPWDKCHLYTIVANKISGPWPMAHLHLRGSISVSRPARCSFDVISFSVVNEGISGPQLQFCLRFQLQPLKQSCHSTRQIFPNHLSSLVVYEAIQGR